MNEPTERLISSLRAVSDEMESILGYRPTAILLGADAADGYITQGVNLRSKHFQELLCNLTGIEISIQECPPEGV